MKKLLKTLLCLIPFLFLSACDSGGGGGGGSGGSKEPIKVVVLGDSITSDVNYAGVPPWPTLMQDSRPQWTVINAAAGNDRAANGRAKIGGLLAAHSPDVVVVMLGSVNAIHGDFGSYESDMRAIVQAAKGSGAKVVLCTVPPMVGPRAGWSSSVNNINNIIRNVASSESVILADVNSEFGPNTPAEDFPNGLHPLLDGQRIIAVTVQEKI
jgi:acyl-CoA thioesterase-1